MRYAALIEAELGWEALLVFEQERYSKVPIKSWGLHCSDLVDPANSHMAMVPLDELGNDLSQHDGFAIIIDPNEPLDDETIQYIIKTRKFGANRLGGHLI